MSRSVPTSNDPRSRRETRSGLKKALRAIAAQAAMLSAAVHFLWVWLRSGASGDPRSYVFLLGGLFTVLIATATLKADEYRRLYALGAGTLGGFLLGYVVWHGGETWIALATDPLAIVGKAAEMVGIVAFVALFRLAPPTSVVIERRREHEGDDSESEANGSNDGR